MRQIFLTLLAIAMTAGQLAPVCAEGAKIQSYGKGSNQSSTTTTTTTGAQPAPASKAAAQPAGDPNTSVPVHVAAPRIDRDKAAGVRAFKQGLRYAGSDISSSYYYVVVGDANSANVTSKNWRAELAVLYRPASSTPASWRADEFNARVLAAARRKRPSAFLHPALFALQEDYSLVVIPMTPAQVAPVLSTLKGDNVTPEVRHWVDAAMLSLVLPRLAVVNR